MDGGGTLLLADGLPGPLWELVRPRLRAALEAVGLAEEFGTVQLSADDLPGDDDAWYRLLPGTAGAPGPVLVITCHPDAFGRRPTLRTSARPPRAVWEQSEAPRAEAVPEPTEHGPERTDIFLHHHLLTVADLRGGDLDGEDLPGHLAEAFAAAWAVGVDGRLARLHLPGYPVSERRGRFSRLFSAGGILLPEHWNVFESLWDGALTGQRAILAAVRLLPRL